VKKPLKKYLLEYYRVTINPKLNFNDTILEQLGFKPCQQCHKLKNIKPNQIITNRTMIGFPLYEKVRNSDSIIVELEVLAKKNGVLYLAHEYEDKKTKVYSTDSIYNRLNGEDAGLEEGEIVIGSICIKQAIPGIMESELQKNYGPSSRCNNPEYIVKYLQDVASKDRHIYCDEIIEYLD
jgi:hypothetical protein